MTTVVYAPQRQIERQKSGLELFIEFLGLVWRGLQWIGDFFQWLASLNERSRYYQRSY